MYVLEGDRLALPILTAANRNLPSLQYFSTASGADADAKSTISQVTEAQNCVSAIPAAWAVFAPHPRNSGESYYRQEC